jgi:RimJ/RimL family protein N-acetyltransferase
MKNSIVRQPDVRAEARGGARTGVRTEVRSDVRAEVHATTRRYAQLPRFFRWFSDHCVLRQLDDSDAPRIWKAVVHPSFSRCWTGDLPRSADDVADFVRQAQSDWLRGMRYVMTVLRKQTHEFVGWVELRAAEGKGAWLLDWFIHPDFVAGPLGKEALAGAADLMFSALEAQKLLANCSTGYGHFERLLNESGFIELVPAGSLDHTAGQPRRHALYELGRKDWVAMCRGAQSNTAAAAPLVPSWANAGMRAELALV